MKTTTDAVWKEEALTERFLEGVRGAIPLAAEQIEVMLRVIAKAQPRPASFLDLGCGDGILGRAIQGRFPGTQGVFLDFSEPMLERARARIGSADANAIVLQDYGQRGWSAAVERWAPFDVVVSGFSIHHQPDARKKELYAEIFALLRPGGIFLNLEHVLTSTPWVEEIFDELFIDSLYAFHRREDPAITRERVAEDWYHRPDKAANIPAPLETQCQWLWEIGYTHVDSFIKIFALVLFGGVRPE